MFKKWIIMYKAVTNFPILQFVYVKTFITWSETKCYCTFFFTNSYNFQQSYNIPSLVLVQTILNLKKRKRELFDHMPVETLYVCMFYRYTIYSTYIYVHVYVDLICLFIVYTYIYMYKFVDTIYIRTTYIHMYECTRYVIIIFIFTHVTTTQHGPLGCYDSRGKKIHITLVF